VSAARMIISEVPRLRVLVAVRKRKVSIRSWASGDWSKYAPGGRWSAYFRLRLSSAGGNERPAGQ
jgi:hypothetical protein